MNKNNNIKIKLLNIFSSKNISYQYHNYKNEEWFVLSGQGVAIVGKQLSKIKLGDRIIQFLKMSCIV